MPVCHLGVFFGGLGWPSFRQRRAAITTRTAPISDLAGQGGQRGGAIGFGRVVARHQHGHGDHDSEGRQPSEDEPGPLSDPVLRGEYQDERGQRDRLETDHQPDEQQVQHQHR